jgi:hypothetical protein
MNTIRGFNVIYRVKHSHVCKYEITITDTIAIIYYLDPISLIYIKSNPHNES